MADKLVPGSFILTAANSLGLFDDKKKGKKKDKGKKPNKKRGGIGSDVAGGKKPNKKRGGIGSDPAAGVAGYKAGGSIKGGKKSIDGIARKGKTKARHR